MSLVKSEADIKSMRAGGKILAAIVKALAAAAQPGIRTQALNQLANELCASYGVKPAFLGYGGFPATVCISVNEEVVHGIPGDRILKAGDLVGIDMGVIHEDFVTDSAVTVPVLAAGQSYKEWGKQNPEQHKLIETTREALALGIKQARARKRVGEIGAAIQAFVEARGFGVVRDLVGHGVGKKLHEEPAIPNYGSPGDGPELVEGMTIAIEPMVTVGDWRVKKGSNNFVFVTRDGSRAAHFEHTILITRKSPEILTAL